MDRNQRDIYLLKHDPNQLIVELQNLIQINIYRFIRSGYFSYDEQQDIKQQINVELLNRITTIQKHYQGKALLRTYIALTIKNICTDILRDRKKSRHIFVEHEVKLEESYENIDFLVLEEEMMRLKKIFGLYFENQYKLILCLKLKFKMIVDINDFTNVSENITIIEFEKFIGSISPYSDYSDTHMFIHLSALLNKYENKNSEPDSLRKWVTEKINELVEILNGNPPTSKYDKETFQILFEKCYFKEPDMQTENI